MRRFHIVQEESRWEAAEVGDEAAQGELSRRLDALHSNAKGVTGLGSFHVDGTGLRIEKPGSGQCAAGEIFLKGVMRLYPGSRFQVKV